MIVINGICYIVGASGCNKLLEFTPESGDIVIAADGGYNLLKKSNIEADILLGDFDSIKENVTFSKTIEFPVEKDDTDTFLAYKYAFDEGYRYFVIFGGMGGRTDHSLANLQMLAHMAKNGARGFLVGDNTIISSIHNSKIILKNKPCEKFGVFSHSTVSKCVSIKGGKYTLDRGELTNYFPLGVSNEFVGKDVEISVSDGTLIVVWYLSQKEFLKDIKNYTEVLL